MKRGHLITEKMNPRSAKLDRMSIGEILALINTEDQTVSKCVETALPRIEAFVEKVVASLKSGGRLVYVGAGTSGRLGVLDASECPPTFSAPMGQIVGIIAGGEPALTRSIEGAEDSESDGANAVRDIDLRKNDCLLGIAAGGTTPYVQGALKYARELGASTGFFTCVNGDEFAHLAEVVISVVVGPEVVTGSTRMKAGTATKMVLNMITTTAMVKLNKTYGNLMVDLRAVNSKLWDRGARIISEIASLEYDEALRMLKSADGEVKTALCMAMKGVEPDMARKLLRRADGSLRAVLEG